MSGDVLIVGSGPAGSIAALVLARAGARVSMIDRATFPRDKLCGDTVNPGALSILERLGCGAAVDRLALRIAGMTVTGPGGAQVTARYPGGVRGAALRRRELDLVLLEAAIAAGARVHLGVSAREPIVERGRVAGVRSSRPSDLRARVVIDAEGRHPRLAFALGLARHARSPRRWAHGACFEGVSRLGDTGEMHVRRRGYLGIAPLPGGLANVCVVTERLQPPGSAPRASLDALMADMLHGDDVLASRFVGARRVTEPIGLGPLAVDASAAGCPGLLLAGDAAGFVDPMTGDGLRFAFRGGELAAAAALRELDTGAAAAAWLARARGAEFRRKWYLNRALRTLVSSPAAVSVSAAVASVWSAPVRLLVGLAGDVGLAEAAG